MNFLTDFLIDVIAVCSLEEIGGVLCHEMIWYVSRDKYISVTSGYVLAGRNAMPYYPETLDGGMRNTLEPSPRLTGEILRNYILSKTVLNLLKQLFYLQSKPRL